LNKADKQLSNPFSTGGGGGHFEAHVQAPFIVLMLAGGFAPCLPCWPIRKIKLQGKFAGYDTDDLIVFVESPDGSQKRKMLAQIKHSISITKNNKVFGEVIQAAWNDFNNTTIFSRDSDVITLITGPLSARDVNDVRTIIEWARHSENAEEFIKKVELTNFSSQSKRNKLQVFKRHLKNANDGNPVSDNILFEFMKHFHLLGYDLDIKAGVTLSLLHSLIGRHSQDNAQALWTRLVDEVQSANKNAGTISKESLPEDLQDIFKQQVYEAIPEKLSSAQSALEKTDWNQCPYAPELVIANLLGAWDENCEGDLEIIQQLIAEDYPIWISRLREVLQLPDSPVSLINGKWIVKHRKALWESLGTRLFDKNLDTFKQCILSVLKERNPRLDLLTDGRFSTSINRKALAHSFGLRKGMVDGLALLGSQPGVLTNCSDDKPNEIAVLTLRELFDSADWMLWGSLNGLLPVLSEAAPDEFLNIVDGVLQQLPSPFDELFSQEGGGIVGVNYLTGLLWALESLAWDQAHLVRVCDILGHLAVRDPGGQSANRPANSLTTILLPWLPQTIASIDKRKAALRVLRKESPLVAWKLVLRLLPNQQQTSLGTHKPSWRNTIPDDWEKGVTSKEYWEQVSFYADLAVSMASEDIERLSELVNHLDQLPAPSFKKMLQHLSSENIVKKPEEIRLGLWIKLTAFSLKCRRFSDEKWALDTESVSQIECIAAKLAPKNPLNLHRSLFDGCDTDLYEERGNWKEQQQRLEERRSEAVEDILSFGGIDAVIEFAVSAESPSLVGSSLGAIADKDIDIEILPSRLVTEDQQLKKFIGDFIWRRQGRLGWEWVDELYRKEWSITQITHFLSYLPFTDEAWERANIWLGKSAKEYWIRTSAAPYDTKGDMGEAINKLIEHGRPHAAIHCLAYMHHNKLPLDRLQTVAALLGAVSSGEPSSAVDIYHIGELIKALQDDPDTNPDDLFSVEWAYLPMLDRDSGISAKLLEDRLTSDPTFFCEMIRLVYRSKTEEKPEQEPTEEERAIATNALSLLDEWKTPPGTQPDGLFSREQFRHWLEEIKDSCTKSGHLDVALFKVGEVLFYGPPEPEGLWIDQAVAEAFNSVDAEKMRRGFEAEAYNSRGLHIIDPTGKPEKELAEQYRRKADEVENAGYQRFAVTLRGLSKSYDRDAERNIAEHNLEKLS
jgi:hypothetical protein